MNQKEEFQNIHIVLVDDEPRIHDMISRTLKDAGMAGGFKAFYDPVSLLEYLTNTDDSIDLILLDVNFENSGLSGIDVIPFIREDHPYLPVVLLTGMEGEEISDAQDYEFIYYIPKPVSPEHLVRMVKFYLGKGKKSGRRLAELTQNLADHKELVELLEEELASVDASIHTGISPNLQPGEVKAFERVEEILETVLRNCEIIPSFTQDLKKLFHSDFKLYKKAISTIVQFDLTNLSNPGLNIHKYYGVENVYSLRLTKKTRLFYYKSSQTLKRRLLRLDPIHDTKGMDKWLKANYDGYAT